MNNKSGITARSKRMIMLLKNSGLLEMEAMRAKKRIAIGG
jgi:hypothetical protein